MYISVAEAVSQDCCTRTIQITLICHGVIFLYDKMLINLQTSKFFPFKGCTGSEIVCLRGKYKGEPSPMGDRKQKSRHQSALFKRFKRKHSSLNK